MVEGGGFEPPKAEPSDLQSDPVDRLGTPPANRKIASHYYPTHRDCQLLNYNATTYWTLQGDLRVINDQKVFVQLRRAVIDPRYLVGFG